MKQMLAFKCSSSKDNQEEINQQCDQIVERATGKLNLAKLNFHFFNFPITFSIVVKIAENSTEYVNRVLDRIKAGIPNGGLEDF